MSTIVEYNGVTLTNVLTRTFSQVAVYDDSNTDIQFYKFHLRFAGIVHTHLASTTVQLSTNTSAISIAQNQVNFRRALMESRGNFTMTIGNSVIMLCTPANAQQGGTVVTSRDVNNGPKPLSCNVTHIAGSGSLRVEWEVELCLVECNNTITNTSGVLSNRWSITDDIGRDWITTRTLSGRLRLAHLDLNAHSFRNWVIPPLQGGFSRESIRLTSSPDGLTLDYQITDRERYAAPPAPGIDWDGTHVISTADGATSHGELNIRITGPRTADKRAMMDALFRVAAAKLLVGIDPGTLVESAALIDHLNENVVELRVQTLVNSGANPIKDYAFNSLKFGQQLTADDVPEYDANRWPKPTPYGTASHAVAGLFICYLQSPCNGNHAIPQYDSIVPTGQPTDRGEYPDVQIMTGPLPTDEQLKSRYNQDSDALEKVHTHYQIDSDFHKDDHTVACPTGAASDSNDDSFAFVKLCRATLTRTVRIAAERYGAPPTLPKPIQSLVRSDLTIRLLSQRINARAPTLSPTGSHYTHSVDAVYEYAFSRDLREDESIPLASLPWDSSALGAHDILPSEIYSDQILT